jgi:hypothetical protein
MDRDRRSRPARPVTWRFSQDFRTLNNGDLHVKPPSADLARKHAGFDQLAGKHVPSWSVSEVV